MGEPASLVGRNLQLTNPGSCTGEGTWTPHERQEENILRAQGRDQTKAGTLYSCCADQLNLHSYPTCLPTRAVAATCGHMTDVVLLLRPLTRN